MLVLCSEGQPADLDGRKGGVLTDCKWRDGDGAAVDRVIGLGLHSSGGVNGSSNQRLVRVARHLSTCIHDDFLQVAGVIMEDSLLSFRAMIAG